MQGYVCNFRNSSKSMVDKVITIFKKTKKRESHKWTSVCGHKYDWWHHATGNSSTTRQDHRCLTKLCKSSQNVSCAYTKQVWHLADFYTFLFLKNNSGVHYSQLLRKFNTKTSFDKILYIRPRQQFTVIVVLTDETRLKQQI